MITACPAAALKIRVMLVDDHPMFRAALRHVLEACADIEVVAEAADGAAACRLADEDTPDIVCMDRRLPLLNGAETIRRLRQRHPGLKVIALSACDARETVAEMLAAGAVAYLAKHDTSEQLVDLIRHWHRPPP